MAVFNVAFPIIPGKVDAARSFASEIFVERRSAFTEFQNSAGVARETWSIQELPDGGALMLVWFEAADPGQVFADLGAGFLGARGVIPRAGTRDQRHRSEATSRERFGGRARLGRLSSSSRTVTGTFTQGG